jgi:hypothetical protein
MGQGTVDGVSFNYCSQTGLAPGEQCLVTVGFAPDDGGVYETAVDLAYADPSGPVAPDAIRHVVGYDDPDGGMGHPTPAH